MALWTQTQAVVTDIPNAYGYLESPPIAFNVSVERCDDESQSTLDARYMPKRGYAQGQETPLRQDAFITGTAGRSGRAFNQVQGTWNSNWSSPYYDTYGILMPDSSVGVAWEVVSAGTTAGIEAAEIIVHRGYLPVGSAAVYTRLNTNCYLHLAYPGAPFDYRIAMEYGEQVRLDWSQDRGATWLSAMGARVITERYLQEHGGAFRFRVRFDEDTQEMWVELADAADMHHWVGASGLGNIRLVGKNGLVALEYYPLRHRAATMVKSPEALVPSAHGNTASARLISNSLTPTPAGQQFSGSIQTDGVNFGFTASASLPDAGEGQGSAVAPKISDVTMLLDEVYSDRIPGDFTAPQLQQLRTMLNEETQTLDDNARCLITSGRMTLNNYTGQYNGAFGNFAIDIVQQINDTARGRGPFVRRCAGIAGVGEEGIGFYRRDPTRLVFLPWADKRVLMMVPIGQEVCFDGWCLFAAVRWIARCCNIHPRYLQRIPYWPDGPADSSCPWPILKRGTGRNSKYRFSPEMSGWSILLLLAQDQGLPIAPGVSLPYFTGFDPDGNLQFAPYDPQASLPACLFTSSIRDVNSNTVLPIIGQLEVFNSTSQLRSEVNFQGLDPISYKLQQVHLETGLAVRKALGYRYPWLERNSRYGSGILDIAQTGVAAASLASQVVRLESISMPGFFAGQTFLAADPQIGVQQYVCIGLQSRNGSDVTGRSGRREAKMTVLGRNVSAYPTANGIFF